VIAVREGVWRVDLEVPRDTATGRRRRKSRQVYGTLEDAERALEELRTESPDEPVVHLNVRLPESVAIELRERAILHGCSIDDELNALIGECLNEGAR
jgi:hypothetical protein